MADPDYYQTLRRLVDVNKILALIEATPSSQDPRQPELREESAKLMLMLMRPLYRDRRVCAACGRGKAGQKYALCVECRDGCGMSAADCCSHWTPLK